MKPAPSTRTEPGLGWNSVFREPHLFGIFVLAVVAIVAAVQGLVWVIVLTLALHLGEALLLGLTVRDKYRRGPSLPPEHE